MYKQLIIEKRYEEAIAYLDEHPSSFIDLSYIYDQKGRLYHLLGNLELAINYLNQAYQLDEDEVTLEELGRCYLEIEDYEQAKQCFIQLSTESAKYNLISIYMALEEFKKAIELLQQLPQDQWVNVNLMICYEMIGKDHIAKEYALLALSEQAVLEELILILERLKEYDSMKMYIDELINQDHDLGMYYLGRYYNTLEQYSKAIECLSKIKEKSEEVYKALIYAYVKENLRKEAYRCVKELYSKTHEIEDLVELIEIGSIAKEIDLINYLDLYACSNQDAFIKQKYIRYYIDFDIHKAKQLLDEYNFEVDESFLLLKNQVDHLLGYSIEANQREILRLRGYELSHVEYKLSDPLPYLEIERIYEFSEGLAYIEGKEYGGFINTKGELVIDFILPKDHTTRMDTYMFHHHKAIIQDHHGYMIIDEKGNILEKDLEEASFTANDIYFIKDGKGVIDGRVYPYYTHSLKENRIAYRDHSLYGYLDQDGNSLIEAKYDLANDFHHHYACVKRDGLFGYIDLCGNEVIPCIYQNAHKVYNNQAVVKKDHYYGVIDLDQNSILDFIYDEIKEDQYYYYVCKDGLWKVYHHNGNIVVNEEYEEILYFWNGVTRVKKNGYYGMINEEGKVVIPIVFDHVTYAKKQKTIVGVGGYFGYMSLDGTLLTPIDFTTATLDGSEDCITVGKDQLFYIIKGESLWKK